MVKNYIIIAIRNLFKHKVFSFINIIGLALSISTGLLVLVILFNMTGYDTFHPDQDRIYRILSRNKDNGLFLATSPMPLKETLLTEYTGIEKVVRLKSMLGGDISYENNSIPLAGYYADNDFFDVFGFELIKGDPKSVLRDPYSLVLTESAAKKLFQDVDPMGKIVTFSDRGLNTLGFDLDLKDILLGDFTVTGIVKDYEASHMNFELLASMSTLPVLIEKGIDTAPLDNWKSIWASHTYMLVDEGRTLRELEAILLNIIKTKYQDFEDFDIEFKLQPLKSITPGKQLGNPLSLRMPTEGFYFLGILSLIIILSACFNYTNLSVARALTRSREIALRKINGASRYQVFWQFIFEAVLISLLAMILAVFILQFLKKGFDGLWINKFLLVDLQQNLSIFFIFVIFSIIIGIVAGLIPAWVLSSFKPLTLITRRLSGSLTKKGILIYQRPVLGKSLIVIQVVLSLFFIITTTLLFFQVKYFINAEYGFNKDNIINIPLRGNDYNLFANEFNQWSGVKMVSGSSILPATLIREGTMLKKQDETKDSLYIENINGDRNFITNLNFRIIAGTNLPDDQSGDYKNSILVNETAVKQLGYDSPVEILGEVFLEKETQEIVNVTGVVEDFHYDIFSTSIGPLFFRNIPETFRYINVRYSGDDLKGTLAFLENKWKELDKVHSFNYQFFDQQLAESHAILGDVMFIIGFVSIIAVVIASMGLLGMVTYNVETRIKEIGIRKVMGASVSRVLIQISGGFLILLVIAIVIATPIAYYVNNLWLRNFAIRVNFNVNILGTSILLVLIVGLLAIGSQTIKAALANPAETLRDE